jgi:hypothetical protein
VPREGARLQGDRSAAGISCGQVAGVFMVELSGSIPHHGDKLTGGGDPYTTVHAAKADLGWIRVVIGIQNQWTRRPVQSDVEKDFYYRQPIVTVTVWTREC